MMITVLNLVLGSCLVYVIEAKHSFDSRLSKYLGNLDTISVNILEIFT